MASTLLEAVLSSILSIILSAPTAIYSLIAIPHDRARLAAQRERLFIQAAKRDIDTLLSLISNVTDKNNGSVFYEQMKNALPYITSAIKISVDILNGLRSDNSFIDEVKYNAMVGNIKTAEEITTPKSVINEKIGITRAVEARRAQLYNGYAQSINNDYYDKRKKLHKHFESDMSKVGSENNITNSLKIEAIVNENSYKRMLLDTEKKEKLQIAALKATAISALDGGAYAGALSGAAARFVYDIELLLKTLQSLALNIGLAYAENKKCQNLCRAMYGIRYFITNLINEIIDLIRKTNVGSTKLAETAVDKAQTLLQVVEARFASSIGRYESVSEKISEVELSGLVVAGHGLLISADSVLNSTITQSLIDHINSDDVLLAANEDFEDFVRELANIPDWDGKRNEWAAGDGIHFFTSPYFKITTDSASMAIKAPSLALSSRQEDRDELVNFLISVKSAFNTILAHNIYVSEVLNSYTPYMTSELGNLKRILAGAGLLDVFANSMSVASVIKDIYRNMLYRSEDSFIVNDANCQAAYPELYESPEATKAVAYKRSNLTARTIDSKFLAKVEANEIERIARRTFVDNTDFNAMMNDDDFIAGLTY